jgi:hypothetical protein
MMRRSGIEDPVSGAVVVGASEPRNRSIEHPFSCVGEAAFEGRIHGARDLTGAGGGRRVAV